MNSLFKALNDKTRRDILLLLRDKDMSAGEIADKFHISKPSISHLLVLLKTAGLVNSEKKGLFIIYSINMTIIEDLMQWFLTFKTDKNEK
jgi:DNA-binding transcriptional ArsR family regulator